MKVVVSNIAASSGGALTLLLNFYEFVSKHTKSDDLEWYFILSNQLITETENIKIVQYSNGKKSWIHRLYYDFFAGKKIIRDLKPDVVISLQNTKIWGVSVPQIVFVQQAIPFQIGRAHV